MRFLSCRMLFRIAVVDGFFFSGPVKKESCRYKKVVAFFVVCEVTYEPGPGIWIRICNYFLYGFRKRMLGPLVVATLKSERGL